MHKFCHKKFCVINLLLQTGWSALMAAVWRNHESIVLSMIAKGATPDIQDAVR